jgi:hypothetical protein
MWEKNLPNDPGKKTKNDRVFKSFVESPSRGENYTSQEVYVGNSYDNPVPVDAISRGESKAIYNEVNSTGLQTLEIINLTVSASKGIDLKSVEFSGENRAVYTVTRNGSSLLKARTYLTWFDGSLGLNEIELSEGDNLKIIVENKTNEPAQFNATLFYSEYNI